VCIWNQRDAGLELSSPAVPWAVRNTPLFLSNSRAGADALVGRLKVRPDRVRVVGNGVELDPPQADRAAWRLRLGVDGQCFLACMLANVQPNKDHATLLRAWRLALDRLGDRAATAMLLLAGRQDAVDDLAALAAELRLENRIRFLGPVEDVAGLLAAVDLAVYSSKSEGCPNGVLECMAAGLPVVGTDIPGIREAVGHEGAAWLAAPGDAAAMAERLVRVAQDAEARVRLGGVNRARVESLFSLERLYAEMVPLLESAWQRRRWPGRGSS
jgi:glycosyltransferase involved in cell wall biosynthesis